MIFVPRNLVCNFCKADIFSLFWSCAHIIITILYLKNRIRLFFFFNMNVYLYIDLHFKAWKMLSFLWQYRHWGPYEYQVRYLFLALLGPAHLQGILNNVYKMNGIIKYAKQTKISQKHTGSQLTYSVKITVVYHSELIPNTYS